MQATSLSALLAAQHATYAVNGTLVARRSGALDLTAALASLSSQPPSAFVSVAANASVASASPSLAVAFTANLSSFGAALALADILAAGRAPFSPSAAVTLLSFALGGAVTSPPLAAIQSTLDATQSQLLAATVAQLLTASRLSTANVSDAVAILGAITTGDAGNASSDATFSLSSLSSFPSPPLSALADVVAALQVAQVNALSSSLSAANSFNTPLATRFPRISTRTLVVAAGTTLTDAAHALATQSPVGGVNVSYVPPSALAGASPSRPIALAVASLGFNPYLNASAAGGVAGVATFALRAGGASLGAPVPPPQAPPTAALLVTLPPPPASSPSSSPYTCLAYHSSPIPGYFTSSGVGTLPSRYPPGSAPFFPPGAALSTGMGSDAALAAAWVLPPSPATAGCNFSMIDCAPTATTPGYLFADTCNPSAPGGLVSCAGASGAPVRIFTGDSCSLVQTPASAANASACVWDIPSQAFVGGGCVGGAAPSAGVSCAAAAFVEALVRAAKAAGWLENAVANTPLTGRVFRRRSSPRRRSAWLSPRCRSWPPSTRLLWARSCCRCCFWCVAPRRSPRC